MNTINLVVTGQDAAVKREMKMQRMLIAYILTGLIFLLLPGTFLGVWNLISISNRHALDSLSPAFLQAHGHAQIFGWIGTFILGIGFYSLTKMGNLPRVRHSAWVVLLRSMDGGNYVALVCGRCGMAMESSASRFCPIGTRRIPDVFPDGLASSCGGIGRRRCLKSAQT